MFFCILIVHSKAKPARSGFSQNLIVLYSLLSSRGLIKHGQYWGSAPGNCQCYSIPCSIQSYWALEVLWHEMGGSWFWILPIVLDLSCSQSRTESANLAIAHYMWRTEFQIIWNAFPNGWCVHWCIMAEIFSQDLLIYCCRVTDFGRKGFIINHNWLNTSSRSFIPQNLEQNLRF